MADVESLFLPPGFRFHPTDEEIIVHYLQQKVADERFSAVAMGEVDLNSCEPWELPKKAKMGEKVWYFFCQKDRKYPTGTRTNRATRDGYWKATGKDKEIYTLQRGKARERRVLVGMKKTLVFYLGRAPKGEKTSWVMHEFRLEPYSTFPLASKDQEWVVCRIFHKKEGSIKKSPAVTDHPSSSAMSSMMKSMTPTTACNHQESTSSFFSSSQMPPPNHPFFSSRSGSSAGSGYLRLQEELLANAATAISAAAEAFAGKCKVEQAVTTSNSIPSHSHDTGVSSDRNADISSYNGEGHHSNSCGPLLNLDNIWEY